MAGDFDSLSSKIIESTGLQCKETFFRKAKKSMCLLPKKQVLLNVLPGTWQGKTKDIEGMAGENYLVFLLKQFTSSIASSENEVCLFQQTLSSFSFLRYI